MSKRRPLITTINCKKPGRRPVQQKTIKQVIEYLCSTPCPSTMEIAKSAGLSPRTIHRIKRDYNAGLYDEDGFRYLRPLVLTTADEPNKK